LSQNGDWLALGLTNQIWILKLEWKSNSIIKVDHFATFEGHRGTISGIHFIGKLYFWPALISQSIYFLNFYFRN
jgi:hypothetical protein